MKSSFVPRSALLALLLASASLTTTFAQTPPTPPPAATAAPPAPAATTPTPPTTLTPEERAHLNKAREQVLATNPTLKAEDEDMIKKRQELKTQAATMSVADKKAISVEGHAHLSKMRAAELALDPTLAPIFAKMDEIHKERHQLRTASTAPTGPVNE